MSQDKKKAAAAKKSRINAGKQNSGGFHRWMYSHQGRDSTGGTESRDRSPVGRPVPPPI